MKHSSTMALLAVSASAMLFGVGCMSEVVDSDDLGENAAALEAVHEGKVSQQGQVSQNPQHKAPATQPRTLAPTQAKGEERVGAAGQKLQSCFGFGMGLGLGCGLGFAAPIPLPVPVAVPVPVPVPFGIGGCGIGLGLGCGLGFGGLW